MIFLGSVLTDRCWRWLGDQRSNQFWSWKTFASCAISPAYYKDFLKMKYNYSSSRQEQQHILKLDFKMERHFASGQIGSENQHLLSPLDPFLPRVDSEHRARTDFWTLWVWPTIKKQIKYHLVSNFCCQSIWVVTIGMFIHSGAVNYELMVKNSGIWGMRHCNHCLHILYMCFTV